MSLKNVLIIDDESTVREAVADILELIDVGVIEAGNGEEGLELFRQFRPKIDVILLDMQMPVMNGEETFHHLRTIDPNAQIIISSGYSEAETMQYFVGQGLVFFLQKPYDIDQLIATIERVIDSCGE
jgi:DNA-binding NtrC family response regulator